MNEKLLLEFDENLIDETTNIFDYYGLDMQTGIKMFLTRVTKDKSVSFLFGQATPMQITENVISNDNPVIDNTNKMTKSYAIRLFVSKGYNVASNVTFASKNSSAYNYWANPNFDILNENWSLILNDKNKQKLYLFNIPARAISKAQLKPRADMVDRVDLQIGYNDITFTDNRSGFSFEQFRVCEINY